LSEYAARRLSADGASIFADGITRAVVDPAAWSFTKPGLLISFNPGEAEAMASGILEVTIPWADLQPLLAPDAPVPR
jgi:hypothetical protein